MERLEGTRQRGASLCSVCGPNINTEDVTFTTKEANLVYMDKVYSYNKATGCLILHELPESRCMEFSTRLKLEPIEDDDCHSCGRGGNCCCCCGNVAGINTCELDSDAVFRITRSFVLVKNLSLRPRTLDESDVTIDGEEVDDLTEMGNQFVATANTAVLDATKKRCADLGLPTKSFFLIRNAGPWVFNGTIVLEGTVNSRGRTCCFQAKFETPDRGIQIDGTSTFAVPKLAIPCITQGMPPLIRFSFTGRVFIINPEIIMDFRERDRICTVAGMLAIEPEVNVEVSRRTLFCIDACEGLLPCDGTEAAFELDDEEDCTWPPPPACRCGTAISPENDADLCDTSIVCDFEDDRRCNDLNGRRGDREQGMQWNGCNGCNSW